MGRLKSRAGKTEWRNERNRKKEKKLNEKKNGGKV